jgi:hypothetical protein
MFEYSVWPGCLRSVSNLFLPSSVSLETMNVWPERHFLSTWSFKQLDPLLACTTRFGRGQTKRHSFFSS